MGAGELGKLRKQYWPADQLFGHLNQVGVVSHDAATQDHFFGQGIHLQYPLDHRVEDSFDDVGDRLAMTDIF